MEDILVTRSSMPSLEEYIKEIRPIWESHWLTNMGPKHKELQRKLEEYLAVNHVELLTNGHMALELTLQALNLQGEVITTPFTFASTTHAIVRNGLEPVFCDIDPVTYNIDPARIEAAVTPRTKAIVPVHLFGQNAGMEALLSLAAEHGLRVVEDACQSIGAWYTFSDGRRVRSGCMGDVGCTSFFPSKNLGCYGDGGAIFTNDDELAAAMRAIANHGMAVRYHHDRVGVNSRLDSIQAAVLQAKLKHLDEYTAARQRAAAYYDDAFKNTDKLVIPARSPQSEHVYHQYTLQLDGIDREGLRQHLADRGIPSMIYYPVPLHLQRAYRDARYQPGDFPVAERLCQCVLSLPMHTELSAEQLEYIARSVLEYIL